MKIIVSGNLATKADPAPAAPALHVIAAAPRESLEPALKSLTEKVLLLEIALGEIQNTLRQPVPPAPDLKPLEQSIQKISDEVRHLEKEGKAKLEQTLSGTDQKIQTATARVEAALAARIQEAVAKKIPAPAPAPASLEESWETLFQKRQSTLVSLRSELESGMPVPQAAVPVPTPAPTPAIIEPPPLDLEDPEPAPTINVMLPTETLPEPPSEKSVISKVWGYLNQSAVEIPITRKKF